MLWTFIMNLHEAAGTLRLPSISPELLHPLTSSMPSYNVSAYLVIIYSETHSMGFIFQTSLSNLSTELPKKWNRTPHAPAINMRARCTSKFPKGLTRLSTKIQVSKPVIYKSEKKIFVTVNTEQNGW